MQVYSSIKSSEKHSLHTPSLTRNMVNIQDCNKMVYQK